MRWRFIAFFLFSPAIVFSQEKVASFSLNLDGYDAPSVLSDKMLQRHYFVFYNPGRSEWEYRVADWQFNETATLKRATSSQIKIKAIWQDTANIYTLYADSKWELRLMVFNKLKQSFSINPLNKTPLQGKLMAIGAEGIALTHVKKKNGVQLYRFVAGDIQEDRLFVLPADVDAKRATKAEAIFNTRDLDKLEAYTEKSKIAVDDQKIWISVENDIDHVLSTDLFEFDRQTGASRVYTYVYPSTVGGRSVAELMREAQSNSFYHGGRLFQCAVSKDFLALQVTEPGTGKVVMSEMCLASEPIPFKTSDFLVDNDFTGVAYERSTVSNTEQFLAHFGKVFLVRGPYDLFVKVVDHPGGRQELTIGGTYQFTRYKDAGLTAGPGLINAATGNRVATERDNVNLFFKSVLDSVSLTPVINAGDSEYDKLVALWNAKKGKDPFNWWGLAGEDPDNRERKKRVKFFQLDDGTRCMGMYNRKDKAYEIYRSTP